MVNFIVREYDSNNFQVYPGFDVNRNVEVYRKHPRITASPESKLEQQRRLEQEWAGLELARVYCPGVTPEFFRSKNELSDFVLSVEPLDTSAEVELPDILAIIETLQQNIPTPHEGQPSLLPVHKNGTHWDRLQGYLDYLIVAGSVKGISRPERARIENRIIVREQAINPFGTTFVHGDVKPEHIGVSEITGKPKIFDFDQSHFGNELEDFVFLATRHPEWAAEVKKYLQIKFAQEDPAKLIHLDEAIAFFEDYFYVKVTYDRLHQSRGKLFDIAARFYCRLALASSISKRAANAIVRVAG